MSYSRPGERVSTSPISKLLIFPSTTSYSIPVLRHDVGKNLSVEHLEANTETHSPEGSGDETNRTRTIQNSNSVLRQLHHAEKWLDRLIGGKQFFETQGIDRIPKGQKKPPSIWNAMMMWFSVTMHVSYLPIGVLAAGYGLSFNHSMASAVVGVCLGALFPAYTGTLGPKLGLRQIATARYSFGFWGAKLCSVLNIIIGAGLPSSMLLLSVRSCLLCRATRSLS